jgi:hypothetical protein
MALTRVQATPKATVNATSITFTFATPPTVGNGIVVLVSSWSAAFPVNGCTDNRGNIYKQAIARLNSKSTAIYYCEKVTASAAPFSVTVTAASSWFVGLAIEVGGLDGYVLGHTSISGSGTSTAPNSGTTAALPKDEVLLAAGVAVASAQSSITVATVSPPWTQEFEELTTTYVPCEGDTRIVTGVAGTTTSASWVTTGSAAWAAVLSAFWQDTNLRVSVAETIGVTDSPTMRPGRLSARVADAVQSWDLTKPPTPAPWTLIGTFTGAPGLRGGTVGGGSFGTWNTTGADLLVVCVFLYWGYSGYSGYVLSAGLSDNKGNAWVPLSIQHAPGSNPDPAIRLFYAKNAKVGGDHRFTINVGNAELSPNLIVYAFSGSHLTEPHDIEGGGSTFTSLEESVVLASVTPWSDGALVLSAFTNPTSTAITGLTATPAMTLTQAPGVQGVSIRGTAGWLVQGVSATVSPTWTWTGPSAGTAAMAVFRAANTQGVKPDRQMVRVQVTPRNRSIPLTLTFPSPPAVGNGIVVYASTYIEYNPFTPAAARDNYGNYYRLAVSRHAAAPAAAIYYCESVQRTGSPFIVTLTHTAGYGENLGAATEVTGVGQGMVLDQVSSGNGLSSWVLSVPPTPPLTKDEVFLAATMNHYTDGGDGRTVSLTRPPWVLEFDEPGTGEGDTRGATQSTGTTPSVQWTLGSVSGAGNSPNTSWPVGVLAAFGRGTQLRVALYEAVTITEKAASSPMSIRIIDRVFVDDVSIPPARTLRRRQGITYYTPGQYNVEAGTPSFTLELPTFPLVGNGLLVLVSIRRWNTALNLKVTDNLKNEYQVVQVIGASSVGAAIAYATVRTTGSAYLVTVSSPGDNNAFWAVTILEVQNDRGIGLTLDRFAVASGSGTAIAVGPTPAHGADEVFTAAAMATNGVYQSALTVQPTDPRWRQEHETLGIMGYWGYEVAGEANTQYLSRVAPRGVATTSAAWTASVSGSWAAVVASFTGQTLQVTVADTITTRESWKLARTPLMRAVFDTVATSEFIGDPQRLLYRERGTFNKVESDNQGEHGFITLNPPPTVGNALAVLITVEWSSYETPLTVTDTYGNVYKQDADQIDSPTGRMRVAVFSTQVRATGPGFTITVAGFEDEDWWPYWVLSAVEISNPAGIGISREASVGTTGTSTTPSATLPALQSAETLLVAVCGFRTNQTFLNVNTVPPTEPPWTVEHEELTRNNYSVGEGDTRIVRAPGTPQTVTWTGSASGTWVAVLVAFQGTGLGVLAADSVLILDGRTPFLYPIPTYAKVWDTITRTEALTVMDGRNTKTTGADPLKVTEAVSVFFGNPYLLEIRAGEYITTRELAPRESPLPGPGQDQTFPLGYALKVQADILRYTGPWPTGDWTASFWSQHHSGWKLLRDPLNYGVWLIGLSSTPPVITLQLNVTATVGSGFLSLSPFDKAWHHFAVVYESGPRTLRVFLDGVQRSTDLVLSGPLHPNIEEQFTPYFEQYMTGPQRVVYYRMWDAALTVADLGQERYATTAARTTNLWRDTPLEANLLDVSGQGRHWALSGTAVPVVGGPGPLPWVAEALPVRDIVAATVQAPHERYRVELVSTRDALRVHAGLNRQLAETLRVGEVLAVAPPDTQSFIKTYRWYTPDEQSAAGPSNFTQVAVATPPIGRWNLPTNTIYLEYAGHFRLCHRFRLGAAYFGGNSGYSGDMLVGDTCWLHNLVSDPLPAQVIAGQFNLCQLVGDVKTSFSYPDNGPRLNFKLYMYVTVGNTRVIRGVLLDYVGPNSNHWPYFATSDTSTASSRWWSLPGDATLTPVAIQSGDRIVMEFGYITYKPLSTYHSLAAVFFYSGYGADAVPQNTQLPASPGPPAQNSWMEFKSGILAYAAEKLVPQTVVVTERLVQRIQILTLTVAETITVETGLLFPIRDFGVAQPVTVTDAVMRRLFDPPLTVTVSETIGHTEATSGLFAIPPPVIVALKLGVMEVIHVEEYRLRAVSTTVMTIVAYEYVYVREREQMAAFPLVWDGSGAPPAPATIGEDYWKVGI